MAPRSRDVFLNAPFDSDFQPIFDAIVFATIRSGFRPRCALEASDSSENRLSKIQSIIESCRFGIHDLSRTETDGSPALPRFNMPLELGIFLGAKRYGPSLQKRKKALILDVEHYRYQRFISDIAGQDIRAHGGNSRRAISAVADWLREQSRSTTVPGGAQIAKEYEQFRTNELPPVLQRRGLRHDELTFGDYTGIVFEYLKLTT